jgi:hypothetical protein
MLMKNIQRETGEKSEEKRIIFKNSFTTIRWMFWREFL